MDKEKKWMLMTYYCPTHGNFGNVQPIEIPKKEISETFLKKRSSPENWLLIIYLNHKDNSLNLENYKTKVLSSSQINLVIF